MMRNPLKIVFVAGAAALVVSCATDNSTSPVASSEAAAALISAPLSFDQLNTSFVGGSDDGNGFMAWGPGDGDQNRFGPGWHEFMGGGIGESFIGGIGFGPGFALGPEFGRGPFGDWRDSDHCAFSTTTSRVVCETDTRHGLTINRSFSFLDASGAVQQRFDRTTTNTVNVTSTVTGTTSHHHGDATSTVNASSDFTVTGLASGSTQRTLDGKSAGTESTTGTRHDGDTFTASRSAGDTISGIKIPIQDGKPTFPTAGTIIRSMQATVTLNGGTPSMSSRREVVTFDGSATATVVITQDGVTKNCTKPLPHGRLSCQ
jgi:hypothetical protein